MPWSPSLLLFVSSQRQLNVICAIVARDKPGRSQLQRSIMLVIYERRVRLALTVYGSRRSRGTKLEKYLISQQTVTGAHANSIMLNSDACMHERMTFHEWQLCAETHGHDLS